MTVCFTIDSDALDNGADEVAQKLNHKRLMDVWLRYGVLAIDEKSDDLLASIGNLPSDLRKMWQTAFKASDRYRRVVMSLGPKAGRFEAAEELTSAAASANLDLACLDEVRALLLIGNESSRIFSVPEGGHVIEACRFDAVDQAASFGQARACWERMIYKSEKRDEVWRNRYAKISKYASRISIVDRYAGKRMLQRHFEGQTCGLAVYLKLLHHLDCSPVKPKIVNIHVSDCDTDIDRLADCIKKNLNGFRRNIASLHLYMARDRLFGQIAHDRFLRFDGLVTLVGRGISIFEDAVIDANFACSISPDLSGDFERQIERVIRENSERRVIL